MHRFFQGYLYPSFTGGTLLKFKSADAVGMWGYFRELWRYANPNSLTYSSVSDPLLMGDVWISWDHTARLMKAFEAKPDDFVAFPAPVGPKGRGFMAVISGLAIPAHQNGDDANLLIDYLTRPAIQARTLMETGFFPVVETPGQDLPEALASLGRAVGDQANSPASIPVLLPIGLGERSGDYNKLFMLTFSEIVLDKADIRKSLDENAKELQAILDRSNAKCWLPDISDSRPCKIE